MYAYAQHTVAKINLKSKTIQREETNVCAGTDLGFVKGEGSFKKG